MGNPAHKYAGQLVLRGYRDKVYFNPPDPMNLDDTTMQDVYWGLCEAFLDVLHGQDRKTRNTLEYWGE